MYLVPQGVCHKGEKPFECMERGLYLVPGGILSPGGVLSPAGCLPGGVPEADTPPPPWTESQTPVKTLPWHNFVAAGNNSVLWMENIYKIYALKVPYTMKPLKLHLQW